VTEKNTEILDVKLFSKFSNLYLIARNIVEGFISGLHKNIHRGSSIEFFEHRKYVPGDDLRYIDWKIFARTDRFYIKTFNEETNLKSYILLDVSNSMNFQTTELNKLQYAIYLAASLSYMMINQKDAVGLVLFDSEIKTFIHPGSTKNHLYNIMKILQEIKPGKETSISKILKEIALHEKKRGLIILISDLLDNPSDIMKYLSLFKYNHHDVIVFHILDQQEIFLSMEGSYQFIDMETGEKLNADTVSLRKIYRQTIEEHISYYKKECARKNISYALANTSTKFDKFLWTYLETRTKIKGTK
jgi:uncharacterized protein (DUF58 family)